MCTLAISTFNCGYAVTPRDEAKFQILMEQAEEYTAVGSEDHASFVCRVTQPLKQRKSEYNPIIGSCGTSSRSTSEKHLSGGKTQGNNALDRKEKKPVTGCVDRASAGSVVALMETTMRHAVFLRPNIENDVILFI